MGMLFRSDDKVKMFGFLLGIQTVAKIPNRPQLLQFDRGTVPGFKMAAVASGIPR